MGTQPAQHRPEHLYLPDAQRIFSLTLRATQGLLDSLFELPLCVPEYSCVSKRARTVKVAYWQPPQGADHRPGYRLNGSESVW